jgi:SAM-dependent methyltransferase
MSQHTCRICGNAAENVAYDNVREMLHGTRETFSYFQCSACGCLQIATVSDDLARHYPSDYQAYKNYARKAHGRPRRFLDSRRVRYELTGEGWIGRLLTKIYPMPDYVRWCRKMGIGLDAKVLDVGCGNGRLLSRMLVGGFTHLRGIDPFIQQDIVFDQSAIIYKRDLPAHAAMSEEKYDLVMLHHSFEHMDNPDQVLGWCSQLVAENGWLLIRVPLADSEAWKKYRTNWYALDPPRHLYLHTSKSMRLLVERCGLVVDMEERDSTESQFVYSELYTRNIAANAPRSQRDIFSRSQIAQFVQWARHLNETGQGDQGVFYIRKAIPKHGKQTASS